ncbi:uncharacterized protein CLAFUR5_10969 [Fulvia fulva]|uniref:Uncharacterized protein n=1 Tax=Passalora fulva TaxID=5499 RepID=A0A9Q8PEW3_PASFU|nr:uncharacterized protein CLAFUR5_10969 [Fulvia fulva]KAK4619027.1 hypothetical protein CLAFUR0_11942 [Fulvia fulva]UJO21213.1 hypothetical protein CLAFUR5_10969 [Fulvia fulva]WPV32733.1 hypothetical protein CLAFUW7_11933 [Fulvia fulva]
MSCLPRVDYLTVDNHCEHRQSVLLSMADNDQNAVAEHVVPCACSSIPKNAWASHRQTDGDLYRHHRLLMRSTEMMSTQRWARMSSTTSEHRRENGRTYHRYRGGENDYWGPNDEQQNDQLDMGHHMLTILLDNKLYLAPIDPSNAAAS